MIDTFQYDKTFLRKAVALLAKKASFIDKVHTYLKPEFFPSPVEQTIVRICLNYYKAFGEAPKETLFNELQKWLSSHKASKEDIDMYGAYYAEIERCSLDGEAYVSKEISEFCKRRAVSLAVLEVADKVRAGNYTGVIDILKDSLKVGDQTKQIDYYIESLESRLDRRWEDMDGLLTAIPTLIAPLDDKIIGLKPKELGVVLGATSVGKSLFLVHIAKAAVVAKKKVAYYTLEMSKADVEDRLDANLTGVPYSKLADYPNQIRARLSQFKKHAKNVVIREFPTKTLSCAGLRQDLERLAADGFVPDVLIIDHGDIMVSDRFYQDKRFEYSSIFEGLRAVAGEEHMAVWTGAQANRSAVSKVVVTVEDMGEDFGKCQIADLILSICRTEQEEQDNKARIFIAKNRRGVARVAVPIVTDYSRMQFYVRRETMEEEQWNM